METCEMVESRQLTKSYTALRTYVNGDECDSIDTGTWLVVSGGIGNLEAILINLQRPDFGFEG